MKSLLAAALATFTLTATAPVAALAADQTAILAGGCFWCIEHDFDKVEGVKDVVVGYTGGKSKNPTYKTHGKDGHREAIKITYDDTKTDYGTLLDIFFRTVNPTDAGGQFCDRGHSYTTAIYAADDAQKKEAEAAKERAQAALGKKIVTPIEAVQPFTDAEGYHQDYADKNPLRYKYYRFSCGRDQTVKKLWGKQAYQGVAKTS